MTVFFEHPDLFIFLIISVFVTLFFLLINFKQLKNNEINKINLLLLELNLEKNLSKKLNKNSEKLKKMENNTQLKLNKIKVSILNFEFSFSEIFKSSI